MWLALGKRYPPIGIAIRLATFATVPGKSMAAP
jgi:hypothetical protein